MSEEKNIPGENSKPKEPNAARKEVGETISQDKTVEQQPEQITPAQPELRITDLQTETMEVHKHPHHVTHKKKWGEYLLEFFMLFLAVRFFGRISVRT